ncbi:YdcF family protein, partial [Salmonella enterica]|nr:YdcF family protein [Salmonella enterica]EIF7428002.1 YdcF family protein [Salmonella enterica]EJQ1414665.1 YdcF family protein [Salmonella enterica]
MNTTPFPALSAATLLAVNTVGQWLAQNDFSGEQPYSSDCVVLAGNAVIPTIDAACRIAKAQGVPLLISGGIGHSTPFLYAVI